MSAKRRAAGGGGGFDGDQCPRVGAPSNEAMTLKACIFAEQAVPRYTSYPTAPHFGATIGPDAYTRWLAELPAGATLSLYLHVPFCAELCHYCGCNTKVVRRDEPVEAYARLLAREIDLIAARCCARRVTAIHWGGGTPSMLGARRLAALTEQLAATFDCAALAEHAIELDPRAVTRELARTLAEVGITRASLGVQEFSAPVQQAIGRVQPFATVATAVDALFAAGITDLNFDLMYGLPHQTEQSLRDAITLSVTLGPKRIALFGYAHVPWFKTHQRLIDETALPGAADRLVQAETAHAMLTRLGYVAIGLDHFARPDDALAQAAAAGHLHRNFQGYTTDGADALIGLGTSAIGRLPQGFVQNAPDIGTYARAIEAAEPAIVRGIALSEDDRLRGRIIERLMCDFAVDLDAVAARNITGDPDFSAALQEVDRLAAEGLVTRVGPRIAMTEAGQPFVRLVAAAFDTYLKCGAARHSRAV